MNAAQPRPLGPRRVIAPEPTTDADLACMADLAADENEACGFGEVRPGPQAQVRIGADLQRRIDEHLKRHRSATAKQLAEAMGCSCGAANVALLKRYKDGMLTRSREKREHAPYVYEVVR